MQFACLSCAQEEAFHDYEGVSTCARDILENFALSDMGFYHCEDCSEVFCSEMDAMQHTKASRNAMQSQCILSGPYVEFGIGAIVPFIDPLACSSAMTSCKFCGQRMQVDQWVRHVRTECSMVPCALCLESLSDAATTYARQKLGESHRSVTMMHCGHIFEPFNSALQCCYTNGTFKKMLRHMQEPSEEHRRGLQCLRDFVMHVDKEAMAPTPNALQVAPSPLQLVTVGAAPFSYLDVNSGSNHHHNQRGGGGTPVGGSGVSCKSPRCASAMVVNVSGKCPEMIRHQKEEAEARASERKKQEKQEKQKKQKKQKCRSKEGTKNGKGNMPKKNKKVVAKKKITKKSTKTENPTKKTKKTAKKKKKSPPFNTQTHQRLPIRMIMKRRREANGEGGKDKQQQEDRPSKRRRHQTDPPAIITSTETDKDKAAPAPTTNSTTTTNTNNTVTTTTTTTTATMITPSMIAKSWVTSSESDPTLRVVVVKPRATKPRPPPPPPSLSLTKAKSRPKPPPPPYPPPPLDRPAASPPLPQTGA